MRSYFYIIDMRVFRSSPPFFFGLLFDPHAHAYNPFNSQRYTLMAEDAVESAGAKAPAITISIQPCPFGRMASALVKTCADAILPKGHAQFAVVNTLMAEDAHDFFSFH